MKIDLSLVVPLLITGDDGGRMSEEGFFLGNMDRFYNMLRRTHTHDANVCVRMMSYSSSSLRN